MQIDHEAESRHAMLREPMTRWQRWWSRFSDQCPPILVKETRQAMKSRSFQLTFNLMLGAFLMATVMILGLADADDYGPSLVASYLVVVAFPMLIVVPFVSFRSLSREYEEDTIQLVSITDMNARVIVRGKLASALNQLAVYLSAAVPCLAIAYMLRGVVFESVTMQLMLLISLSLMLNAMGLMFAGLSRHVALKIIANLLLLAICGIAFYLVAILFTEMNLSSFGDADETRMALVGSSLVMLAATNLFYEGAVGLVANPVENRTTRLKFAGSILLWAFVTFVLSIAYSENQSAGIHSATMAITLVGMHFWIIFGTLATFERDSLTERVRRTMPRTVLQKILYGLYMPGSSRGYLFGLTGIWSLCAFAIVITEFAGDSTVLFQERCITIAYHGMQATFYLSVASVMRSLPLLQQLYRPVFGLLCVTFVYFVIQFASLAILARLFPYGLSRGELYDDGLFATFWWEAMDSPNATVSVARLLIFALITVPFLLLALIQAIRSLHQQETSIPPRVIEEMRKQRTVETSVPAGESIEEIFASRRNEN